MNNVGAGKSDIGSLTFAEIVKNIKCDSAPGPGLIGKNIHTLVEEFEVLCTCFPWLIESGAVTFSDFCENFVTLRLR